MTRRKPLPLKQYKGGVRRGLLANKPGPAIKGLDALDAKLDTLAVDMLNKWKEGAHKVLRDAGLPTTPEDNLRVRLLSRPKDQAGAAALVREIREAAARKHLGAVHSDRGAIADFVRAFLQAARLEPLLRDRAIEHLSVEHCAAVLVDAINHVLKQNTVSRIDAVKLAGAYFQFLMASLGINDDAAFGQKTAADLEAGPREKKRRAAKCAEIVSAHMGKLPPIYKGKLKEVWDDERRRKDLASELLSENLIKDESELTPRRMKDWHKPKKRTE
jgi:hypothetical protein